VSKAEILAELPRLAKEDRAAIQARLEELATYGADGWLEGDEALSKEEKALIDARLDELEKHPEKSIPWPLAEAKLKARFGE
jgi:hypothetical protein